MKISYGQIKEKAKKRLSQRFGDAAIIVFIPGIIVWIINLILGQAFIALPTNTSLIIRNILSFVFSMYTGYIILKLLLKFGRGKNGVKFEEFFQFDDRFVPYVIYSFIISLINILAFLPVIPLYIDLFNEIGTTQDPAVIEAYLTNNDVINQFIAGLGLSFAILLVVAIILVRLSFTTYLILDQNLSIVDAMKKSMAITKGNWWRIFFFPFTFILWFLLVLVTCGLGIIYVGPLFQVAYVYFYFALIHEYGDDVGEHVETEPEIEIDYLAEDYDMEEEEKKDKDPLDYYE